ncbi:hypothetical protein Goarm_002768 [Gossypium armourianum]|uniref:Transmembrane protein n=1 Tax=Gossypium armourianum TaxID=34283 RepID=A0A7J9K1D2_9ROSI|nr:hypothetical protein [Gossypium armourianum]
MEGIHNVNPWDCFKSIEITTTTMVSTISNNNDPLFSCIITVFILILLYFPHRFFSLRILFSPVLVLTASLLFSLLRLGVTQRTQTETAGKIISPAVPEEEDKEEETDSSQGELKWETCKNDPDLTIRSFEEMFVEWDVKAPLEVIYEEGDEVGKDPDPNQNQNQNQDQNQTHGIERYPSLSLYYPESDSDSSSSKSEETDFPEIGEWVSSEKIGYRWEEEDKEGLIEIVLEKREIDFHGEDDNLIEIDIS